MTLVKKGAEETADAVGEIPTSVDLGDGESNIKKKAAKSAAGVSSLAAIGGGGRVGRLATIEDKQLDELKIQTKVIQKVEKNTSKQTTSKFK